MVNEIINWGVKPRIVTGDSWYFRVENLKFLKNQKLAFILGIQKKYNGLKWTIQVLPGRKSGYSRGRIKNSYQRIWIDKVV